MTKFAQDVRPMDDPPLLTVLRTAYDIHEARVARDGADRCINCGRDLKDVPSFGACPECGCEN